MWLDGMYLEEFYKRLPKARNIWTGKISMKYYGAKTMV